MSQPPADNPPPKSAEKNEAPRRSRSRSSTIGESRVWLCGMGLSLGIVMVIGLLGLIVVNGLGVFMPK